MSKLLAANAPVSGTGVGRADHDAFCRGELADRYPLLDAPRAEEPVHWSSQLAAWIVTSFEGATQALRDPLLKNDRVGKLTFGSGLPWLVGKRPSSLKNAYRYSLIWPSSVRDPAWIIGDLSISSLRELRVISRTS